MRILHVFHKVHEIVISVCLVPIRLYQRFISPLKGQPSCRFSPTCSQYCVEAVREWGILIGAALTLWRVLRCNPFARAALTPYPDGNGGSARRRKNRPGCDSDRQGCDPGRSIKTIPYYNKGTTA